jgi:anti-sigma factor RsiW
MGTETNSPSDFERINAFVDGELSPGERADVAARISEDRSLARAHATIARLKACVGEGAEAAPDGSLILPAKRSSRLPLGVGAAVVGGLALLAIFLQPETNLVPIAARDAVITLASLPATPMIPDLGAAGLRLSDIDVDRSGPVRILVATYLGPHGCRLDLRVRPAETAVQPADGTSRRAWMAGGLSYELVAHGMPAWRFTLIAEAAERETRSSGTDGVGRRLREARAAAAPCVG